MIRFGSSVSSGSNSTASARTTALAEFCKYVPLRLSGHERALLTVLESTLHVSEYTDNVDVASNRRGLKARRILDGILEACHIASGLIIASGHEQAIRKSVQTEAEEAEGNAALNGTNGGRLKGMMKKKNKKNRKASKRAAVANKKSKRNGGAGSSSAGDSLKENAALFQTMFEVGRRNKVLNPSQMRTTYGKLMYLMQDAQNPTVAKSLGFTLHKDLVLVRGYLEEYDCGDLLFDDRLAGATEHISDRNLHTGEKVPRDELQQRVQEKRQLLDQLVVEYASKSQLSEDNLRRAIESISDAIAYVQSNIAPVRQMLEFLEDNFDPAAPEKPFSLELRGSSRYTPPSYSRYGFSAFSTSGNNDGPTLSHSHSTQFTFVWQSLRLWQKVQRNMHKLWVCADDDLLSTSTSYHLYNTGQGLNRVQACPKVGRVMRNLLQQTQSDAGAPWVGLSVIHLGDRDVPNALIFIDKYTQIPRFLNPLVSFLRGIDDLCDSNEMIDRYIKAQFGSRRNLRLAVLSDYFKHGFDGSGDDGGSCIDGRLTSSWNWTSRIAKKAYYHVFMLSGFQGFDGDFK